MHASAFSSAPSSCGASKKLASAPHPRLRQTRVSAASSPRVTCRAAHERNHVMYTDATVTPPQNYERVGDVMTTGVVAVEAETPVLEALQLVVDMNITGLPVVDEDNRVVGVVSDFDLLAMDRFSMRENSMFPPIEQSWQAFNAVKRIMEKVEGKSVEDFMTKEPTVVRSETSLDAAAKILLESKIRRLPVVDKYGKLVGLLTRRDVVVAALAERKRKDV